MVRTSWATPPDTSLYRALAKADEHDTQQANPSKITGLHQTRGSSPASAASL
ncbi:hypothetical protein [Streptomyces brevispora]|uniref:hypothetical protein n=1 Tax=Streptomyces brevispora TaxID=887462 RepID=UPI00371E9D04